MEIVQSFYFSPNLKRHEEIDQTLRLNLSRQYIEKIHLFITQEDLDRFNLESYPEIQKIVFITLNVQPTYVTLLEYVSQQKNKICVIANSDIEFRIKDEDLHVLEKIRDKKIAYFITRDEFIKCKDWGGSHDAFIFHSDTLNKAINNKDLSFINYVQNTSGIEALLTIQFIDILGYKLLNPCLQVFLVHHHQSNVRLWACGKPPVGYTNQRKLGGMYTNAVHCTHMVRPITIEP